MDGNGIASVCIVGLLTGAVWSYAVLKLLVTGQSAYFVRRDTSKEETQ